MASDNIGSVTLKVGIDDAGALADLRRLQGSVDRTMQDIGRQRAIMEIEGNLGPLKRDVLEARTLVKDIKGEIALKGNTKDLQEKLAEAKALVDTYEADKAVKELTVHADLQGYKDARREAALLEKEQKAAFNEQKARAKVTEDLRKKHFVGDRQEAENIARLNRQYLQLSERMQKMPRRRPFDKMEALKLDLDQKHLVAQMEAIRGKLEFLGAHPPVEIKTRIDRSALGQLRHFMEKAGDAAEGFGRTTVRLGPITTTIKTAVAGMTLLGSAITDVIGSGVALVGVLGTGIAGAAAVGGAGLAGMALNFGGVFAAMRPMIGQYKNLSTLQKAYDKALLDGDTKAAAKAQQKLNAAYKNADPNLRSAVKAMGEARRAFDGITRATAKRNFGDMIAQSARTAKAVLPTLAHNTNDTMNIIGNATTKLMEKLRGGGAISAFDKIGKNFNDGLKPALNGMISLGVAMGRVAASASRLLGPAGSGFQKWAKGIEDSTADTAKLDETIDRLGRHARDVGKFFMSLGRLMTTVLNGGADAGDNLANSMTETMNRWNELLKSPSGQQSMAKFFKDAATGAKALWNAITPLASAFLSWSEIFSPVMVGASKALMYVGKLVSGFLKFTHMQGPAAAIGATLAGMFVLTRVSTFLSMLKQVHTLINLIGASAKMGLGLEGIKGAFSTAFKGNSIGGSIASASAEGANAYRVAIMSASEAGATMFRTAEIAGGAAGAGENALGSVVGSTVGRGRATSVVSKAEQVGLQSGTWAGAAETGAETAVAAGALSKAGKAASLLRGGLTAITEASLGTQVGLALLGGYVGYKLVKHFFLGKSAMDKFRESSAKNTQASRAAATSFRTYAQELPYTAQGLKQANMSLSETRKRLKDTKDGTDAHRQALMDYRAAYRDQYNQEQQYNQQKQQEIHTAGVQADADKRNASDFRKASRSKIDELRMQMSMYKDMDKGTAGNAIYNRAKKNLQDIYDSYDKLNSAAQKSANRQAAVPMNLGRAWRGQLPVLGAAEQALGKLARTRPNLAQNISVKFDSPKDVGSVSRAAQQALNRGGGITTVMKIIADSKSAEDALRKLHAYELPAKEQRIIESGGSAAVSMLEKLTGIKLTPKQSKTVESGGKGALHVLEQILGITIPPKRVTVNTNAAKIAAEVRAIESAIQALHDKTVNIFTVKHTAGDGLTGNPRTVKARGGRKGDPGWALVGEGASGRGAPEMIANHKTGQIQRVDKPTVMKLGDHHSVIPTESAYRTRGRDLFAEFAKDMGIPGFAGGKGAKKRGPGASPQQLAAARSGARIKARKAKFPSLRNLSNLFSMDDVNAAKKKEDGLRADVQNEDTRISETEPDSFLTVDHTDPFTGEPIYAIDQKKLDWWRGQLDHLRQRYFEVYQAVQATQAAVYGAETDVRSYLSGAEKNRATLLGLINAAHKEINTSQTNAAKGKGQARLNVYKKALGIEDGKIKTGHSDLKDILVEKDDIGGLGDGHGRLYDANDAIHKIDGDIAAVSDSKINDQLTDANPKPQFSDPLQQAEDAKALGDSLTQVDQLKPLRASMSAADQSIYDIASGYLTDTNPGNDSAGESAIGNLASTYLNSSGSGVTQDQQAVANQQAAALSLANGNAQRNAGALAAFMGYGDIGAGDANAYMAGSSGSAGIGNGGNIININTLHPGDPAVYRAIGNAAATGFDYQNGINSSRGQVG